MLGSDNAVAATRRLAAVDERSVVAGRDHSLLEALRADRVVVVEGAVVELAETDGQAGPLEQAVLDESVSALGLSAGAEGFGLLADGGERFPHVVGPGTVADRLAAAVGVEEVPEALKAALIDGRVKKTGP
ncbi:hypothetical protein ACFV90_40635 [Streptomyces sp. NPDC059904]|uniref:hypothetical protein n=1 Tax=unclassified Streptomyces TaxID=2593676 RepID=UPI003648A2A5